MARRLVATYANPTFPKTVSITPGPHTRWIQVDVVTTAGGVSDTQSSVMLPPQTGFTGIFNAALAGDNEMSGGMSGMGM